MVKLPDGLELVALGPERLRDILELDMWAFPTSDSLDDLLAAPSPLSWDRVYGVTDPEQPGQLVAMHGSYPFATCPVPGGRLPVAGLTWVGVHPQWRRRGLLNAMIAAHFDHCREHGEPVSLLTASEPVIYGRYGYGLAARQLQLKLSRRAALRPVAGTEGLTVRLELLGEAHAELVGRLHAAVDRPGWVTRETAELATWWLDDSPVFRGGRETARIVVVDRGPEPVGYAIFRRKGGWGITGPEGSVRVFDAVATDPAVAHVLWSRLLDLDLTTEIYSGTLAVDDPLLSLLVDVRAAEPRWQDNTWLRLIDLPAALAGRRYQADIDVVLDVTDPLLPGNTGRWRLTAAAFAEPSVTRCDDDADLALDIRELGAAYLGGTSLVELAGAGLVKELTPGSLDRAGVAFGWVKAPVTNWIF